VLAKGWEVGGSGEEGGGEGMSQTKDEIVADVLRVIRASTAGTAPQLLKAIEAQLPHLSRKQIIEAITAITDVGKA
jgi:hypothetical protein